MERSNTAVWWCILVDQTSGWAQTAAPAYHHQVFENVLKTPRSFHSRFLLLVFWCWRGYGDPSVHRVSDFRHGWIVLRLTIQYWKCFLVFVILRHTSLLLLYYQPDSVTRLSRTLQGEEEIWNLGTQRSYCVRMWESRLALDHLVAIGRAKVPMCMFQKKWSD